MSATTLLAHGLVKVYGDRRVLDGVGLTASPGQRIGLVGENGVGKSTLLRLLAGVDDPDDGVVTRPQDTGYLHQEIPFAADTSIAGVLDAALAEVRAAERDLAAFADALAEHPADAEALAGYARVLDWVQAHEAWDADRRADMVLDGLGLSAMDRSRTLRAMSGGQRTRLGLAALLVRQPGALVLDEPTNHLDDAAVEFLERHLRALPGVVVLASHDRVFLDAVCSDIVDLDPARGGPTRYGGTYSDYLDAKRAERARWEQQYVQEQEELGALRYSVSVTAPNVNHDRPMRDRNKMAYGMHGGRVQKQISRRVRNARQRLDELIREQVRKPPPPLRFSGSLGSTVDSPAPALSVRDLRVDGRLSLPRLDIAAGEQLLVTGPNGAGKSTLLAVLAGALDPSAGTVSRRRGLRVGLLEQDVWFARPERTPSQIYSGAKAAVPLSDLGLLSGRDLQRPVGDLSVGQRRRLALALLVARAPELLLLDEPTNHISLSLAEELEEALRVSAATVVVATHDRWLRRRWRGTELALTPYERCAV